MNRCPDSETIAALVDDAIKDQVERRRIEEHVADCDRCYFVFRETALLLQEERSRAPVRRKALQVAAGLAALFVALFLLLPLWPGAGPSPRELRARLGQVLEEAELPGRPTAGRLALDTEHAPWLGFPRNASTLEEDPRRWALFRAASEIYEERREGPDPEDREVLGLAHLLLGQPAAAIENLEGAASAGGSSAELSNDLAAAYLDLALREDQPQALAHALSWVERSLELDPDLPEARFNRALILQRLRLAHQAIRAWESYLELDSSSPWADEAREHRSELRRRLDEPPVPEEPPDELGMLEPWVSEHPQRAREHLQEELLPAWGLGTTEDAGDLKRAVRIAKTLEDRQGDGSLLVLVEETRRATARGGSRLRRLKDAHASYGRGMELLDHRPGEATPELERAARLWKELGSPAEGWARIWSITSRYLRGTEDRRQLRRDLHRFRDLWDRSEVPLLRARGLWTDGHLASLGVALGDSLASYRQAYALFSSAGEIDHASFVAFLVAETYARLGNEASAWRWVERSLSIPGLSRSSERYPWTLIGIATLNTNEPVPEAALAFLAESLSLEAGPLATLEAHRHRARLMMEMGLHRRAEEEIREVSPLLRALDDSGLRRRVRAELLAVQARATAELSPHRALEMVEDAGSRLREIGLTNRTPRFALAASRAHRRLGQLERASTRLTGAVERLEREASKVTPAPEWNPVPAARELFDRLLDLGWSLEEAPESLLALAERGRLVGRAQLGDWEAIPGRLSRSLATNEGVVYFSTLPDRVLSWVITDSGVEMVQSPVSRGTLRSWVRATTRFLVSGRGAPPEGMTAAREGLLLPILERLPPEVDRITVVPDGPLHGLPFVALRDEKGRFLGDRFTLAIGLTATSLLKPDRRPAGRGPGERRALVLADPAFDQILFPDLPRLSGAREEGQAVAGLFRDSTLLTGTNATAERFRRLAPGHEIIHFAGHAVVNGHDPSRSNLLLASSPEMPGPLFVEDILDLPLESTELVILSSCSAGSGSPTGTGPASLARAFLEAGASRVVASLWPVSDQRASFILLDFHRRLREGLDPATALRRSQTELRHRGDSSTASWAAFQLYRS